MAFSIETTITGWHFDVMDPDDIVDPLNCATPQGIAKVKKNFRVNRKTLMPWGYINGKATRHDPHDFGGEVIKRARPGKVKILCRAALTLHSGKRLEPGDFPPESEMTLLFPSLLNYEFLKDQFEDDYSSFMTQYMNDAHGGHDVIFGEKEVQDAQVRSEEVPIADVIIYWRLAVRAKENMQMAGAAVGVVENGRLYVIDAKAGKFRPSLTAHQVVMLAKKHGTHDVRIEDTPGARYHEGSIHDYGAACGWPVNLHWVEYQEDDAQRDQRIQAMEPMVQARRIVFSDSIPEKAWEMVFEQFTNYGMIDAIELPDVIARLAGHLPKEITIENKEEIRAALELMRERDVLDRMEGLGHYAPVLVEVEKPYKVQDNPHGLSDDLPGLNA